MTSNDPLYVERIQAWGEHVARELAAERRRAWRPWALTLAGLASAFAAAWAVAGWWVTR